VFYSDSQNIVNIKDLHAFPGKHCYNVDYSNIDIPTGSKILLHFGEIDIRKSLPKYKNTEETVKRYIDKSVDYFKDYELFFIKPIPQAEDSLTWEFKPGATIGENKRAYYLEERLKEQNIFYSTLDQYADNVIDTPSAINTNILKAENTDDGCHLNLENSLKLIKYIDIAINSGV